MCGVAKCEKPVFNVGRQLCAMHYARWQRHGDVTMVKKRHIRGTPEERFWSHIRVEGDCWIWLLTLDQDGYGHIFDGKRMQAHRWAYQHFVGPVWEGLQLDHFVCDRPACVNPAHVRPVTPRENTLRGNGPSARNAAKTHCKRGHVFDETNTYIHPRDGSRHCRACQAWHQREWKRKRR